MRRLQPYHFGIFCADWPVHPARASPERQSHILTKFYQAANVAWALTGLAVLVGAFLTFVILCSILKPLGWVSEALLLLRQSQT